MTAREHPILFSGPMVRALLLGTKTQTRRVVRLPSDRGAWEASTLGGPGVRHSDGTPAAEFTCLWNTTTGKALACPYGAPGDRLWVREAWSYFGGAEYLYQQDRESVVYRTDGEEQNGRGWTWRPSIHMPRWASRITLEVTEVRVQRLQDISEEDAQAEGAPRDHEPCDHIRRSCEDIGCLGPTYRASFCELWDSINGDRTPWKSNPWVWAISFRMVTP
jgi:hypothetical protein